MYGKFFASAFTGSMLGAGSDVFAVWGYVIANTVGSQVELNPRLIAVMIGTTPEAVTKAIDYLCAPDANSRSKVEEGRRLVREGEFAYRVPNYEAYRSVRSEDDRREYNRIKQAEHRQKKNGKKAVKASVNDMLPMSRKSAQEEEEADTEEEKAFPRLPVETAEAAWEGILALVPDWHARTWTAERHAALSPATKRGLKKVGGVAVIVATPDEKRHWKKVEFMEAYNA